MSALLMDWDQFVAEFYASPNDLRVGEVQGLDAWLDMMRDASSAVPRRPVVVPFRVGPQSGYYALAADRAQARVLRTYLAAAVGPPLSNFDGMSVHDRPRQGDLDAVATRFAGGDSALVFVFEVPPPVRAMARTELEGLLGRLAAIPIRSMVLDAPVGRLVGDFNEACAGRRRRAAEVALERLLSDHRVTARNRLFLQVEFMAAFEEWEQLESLLEASDLLRLNRPALVSDALARFVLAAVIPDSEANDLPAVLAAFGALVPATSSIRSQQGANYYGLWAVSCGESVIDVAGRVEAAGWSAEWIRATLGGGSRHDVDSPDPYERARLAIEQGRLDAAVAILAGLEPRADLFPAVLRLVIAVGSAPAIALLTRYHDTFGAPIEVAHHASQVSESPPTLGDALDRLADPVVVADQREACLRWLREQGPSRASAGELDSAAKVLRDLLGRPGPVECDAVIDASLDLATELRRCSDDFANFSDFGMAVLELWAFSSQAQDRHRMEHVINLTLDVLTRGLSAGQFSEVVEYLRACWDPFLSDAHAEMSIDVVENLLYFSPAGTQPVLPFALPILSRLGSHNARRIGRTTFDVARVLASECGLELEDFQQEVDVEAPVEVPSAKVLIYSLMTTASARAASILLGRYPQLEIETRDDHVGTDRLRQLVRRSDVVIITDRAAKHPATDAIRVELAGREPVFAMGRGSSSIVEAAEGALMSL